MTEYRFKNYIKEITTASKPEELEETMTYIMEEDRCYRRNLLIQMVELQANILNDLAESSANTKSTPC